MEYGAFLDRVAVRSRVSPDLAEPLTRAVLHTLAEHIDAGEASDLAGMLPEQLRGDLIDERISAEGFPASEFFRRIDARADLGRPVTEDAVRGVLETVHETVTDAEWTQLMAQLPLEFRELA
ncbi:DUF2267 domain-containing protein [Planosporangium flavigriseum]|uniref:DUF2267 domain-containing protein n=1 Tax=Planosporangium flavigriseum TaxID=373681 RepID=A0A8J3LPJ7_9ACTN|nr:DUF2267 domain-containing protein [Planosporangium flavigriseum]NJC65833.1 DUF2267 domain-containing protein [Planosporangium flavigriseum]GIG76497.1 hypothetical protein Pfl04_49010 [Planosporangium flavigriseum]